ncbi:hypothetical protein AGLY_017591, partial [Aphis glycines]
MILIGFGIVSFCLVVFYQNKKSYRSGLVTVILNRLAAPTPVSSLVHSSTLVTAVISCLTILIAGLNAIFEFDLKKIIAFSTLRQIRKIDMCFFYLLIHALFKSIIFLRAGILILNINNNQDIRKMGGLVDCLPFCGLIFIFTLISLCGFPFFCKFKFKILRNNMEFIIFK